MLWAAFSFIDGLNGAFPYPLADFRPENFDLLLYLRKLASLARSQFFPPILNVTQTECISEDLDIPIFIDQCITCFENNQQDPIVLTCDLPEGFLRPS